MLKPSKAVLSLIIANEFCERFCYYGFRALLYQFLREMYKKNIESATNTVHLFNFLCYVFTFIGGVLSDNILGRYHTILYLSIVYLFGTIFTTISSLKLDKHLLKLGLLFISIGTGGIKSCVSTFGGDQFDKNDIDGKKMFFSAFYFSINAGSLISIFLSPIIANFHCHGEKNCYPEAFGLPAALLALSCVLFVLGKKSYVKERADSKLIIQLSDCLFIFLQNLVYSPLNIYQNTRKKIIRKYGLVFYADILLMLDILKIFALVPIFWMLYDQQSSTWIEQGTAMNKHISFFLFSFDILPSQMQAINGVLILVLIPLFVKIIYPMLQKNEIAPNSIQKMGLGIFFISLSFFTAAIIEYMIYYDLSIFWQFPQYILLTIGEIFLSLTGIEFVYAKSPEKMKGLILSFWLMTVAIGNMYVMFITSLDLAKWLNFKNAALFNFTMYGTIGMITTLYFFKQSKKFTHSQ